MKASEFVTRLLQAAPKKEELARLGFNADEADDFVKLYYCRPRKSPLNLESLPSSENLTDLFTQWDPGGVRVGPIEFLSEPVATARGLQIGVEEVHPILISPQNSEVVVEEYGVAEGHRLSEIASSGDSLLDALAKAAAFLAERVVGKISFDDFAAARVAAGDCAELAGGKRYLRFFINLLGANE